MVVKIVAGSLVYCYYFCSQETSSLKKDLERLEKKSKELKERIKGKLGAIPGLGDDNQDDEEGNE